jgi:hypothetical protein
MIRYYKILSIFLLLVANTAFARPVLTLSTGQIEFGMVPQNSLFRMKVVLKSEGDQPVVISKIDTYCDCIKMPLERTTIPPGDSLIMEVSFFSMSYVGNREWRAHIVSNSVNRRTYLSVSAFIVANVEKLKHLYVSPHTVNASQFGDHLERDFTFRIINKSDENIPLSLLYTDDEFFDIDFPGYILSKDTALGRITLNEKGVKSEFEKSITFEYVDEDSELIPYSIPVRRKIFRAGPETESRLEN